MAADAKYLLVTIKDVDPNNEEDYAKWMGEEHMPDLLTVPGVIRALRYVSRDGSSPRHMAIYELERADIPDSQEWEHAAHSERTKYMAARWQSKARNIFELVEVVTPPGAKRAIRR